MLSILPRPAETVVAAVPEAAAADISSKYSKDSKASKTSSRRKTTKSSSSSSSGSSSPTFYKFRKPQKYRVTVASGAGGGSSSEDEDLQSSLSMGYRRGQPPRGDVVVKMTTPAKHNQHNHHNHKPVIDSEHSRTTTTTTNSSSIYQTSRTVADSALSLTTKVVGSSVVSTAAAPELPTAPISSRVPTAMQERYQIPGLFIKPSVKYDAGAKAVTAATVTKPTGPATVSAAATKEEEESEWEYYTETEPSDTEPDGKKATAESKDDSKDQTAKCDDVSQLGSKGLDPVVGHVAAGTSSSGQVNNEVATEESNQKDKDISSHIRVMPTRDNDDIPAQQQQHKLETQQGKQQPPILQPQQQKEKEKLQEKIQQQQQKQEKQLHKQQLPKQHKIQEQPQQVKQAHPQPLREVQCVKIETKTTFAEGIPSSAISGTLELRTLVDKSLVTQADNLKILPQNQISAKASPIPSIMSSSSSSNSIMSSSLSPNSISKSAEPVVKTAVERTVMQNGTSGQKLTATAGIAEQTASKSIVERTAPKEKADPAVSTSIVEHTAPADKADPAASRTVVERTAPADKADPAASKPLADRTVLPVSRVTVEREAPALRTVLADKPIPAVAKTPENAPENASPAVSKTPATAAPTSTHKIAPAVININGGRKAPTDKILSTASSMRDESMKNNKAAKSATAAPLPEPHVAGILTTTAGRKGEPDTLAAGQGKSEQVCTSLIVPDFFIPVYGSSCNSLYFGLLPAPFLPYLFLRKRKQMI